MANVMLYGGGGARDPLQQPPHRLDSAFHICSFSALPPKRRGISRGINLEKVWQANGKMPMQPIENNAKYFTGLVENQVRFTMPPCYPSWTEVPEEQRARLRSIIEDKLVELKETQHTQVASSDASLDEHAITNEVLGERRGHVCGVGRVSKGTSSSLDSTAASKAPQGTSQQFSRDAQNNDPRLAMYEA
ncbi:hypothetical protein Adt_04865 [Abeliophyllum distichum]|uniref:Uncharacterized protein n=1 Tax=Abeliophyllum distichum TaxID=126358 RepID=A0ABD1V2I4_9LAMI